MRIRAAAISVFMVGTVMTAGAQRGAVLPDVATVKVEPTMVADPDKVKEDFAVNLMTDSLINALKNSNYEVGESSLRAHILLEEFSSGSTAKRVLVGLGAGRSTVQGRLIFNDATGRELANVSIRVRGNLLFSGYQGGNTQRRQATNAFEQKLIEEIARIKPAGTRATQPTVALTAPPTAPASPPASEPLPTPPATGPSAPARPGSTPPAATAPSTPAASIAPPAPSSIEPAKAAPKTDPAAARTALDAARAETAPPPAPAEPAKPAPAASVDAAAARTALEAGARAETAKDWPAALQQYERARTLDPTMATFIDVAIARVHERINGPVNEDALRRARQYDALGRRTEAITWYQKALESMPESDPNREPITKRLSELTGK